ncbi:putative protein family UPF0615 [Niveomyces insectorum RCEF 264]|uniref:Maintenance of telomere capping protein 1 n=1 Tax=Niveomyces insectorum RCEF 264 TaxID=1081102 RepID=A0A167VPC6_9HYPO|nr:putative protein family UPF0615 [Niveomyces insectorum RCEF 264]
MANKRAKNAATDELDELFEGIGGDEKSAPLKTGSSKTKAGGNSGNSNEPGQDILAELENELEAKQSVSRPHTPRVKEITTSAAKGSPARRAATGTPPPAAPGTTALPRRSAESAKSAAGAASERKSTEGHAGYAQTQQTAAAAAAAAAAGVSNSSGGGGGGGWWGGILSTASAAMKQAEAAVKEIQKNEEAKKWAEQVRGNYTVLRGYGDELIRQRALPTFTNILHTLAPPIAAHERLLIHVTHDMVGYPALDPLVYGVFSRVMAQVEGGDLLVLQRGQEHAVRSTAAGWRDGPWWRAVDDTPRDLGAVPGLHEGTKLCRASAEAYANEYYAADGGGGGGLAAARERALAPVSESESSPVRRSDLFLAVQAVATGSPSPKTGTEVLFAGSTAAPGAPKDKTGDAGKAETDEEEAVDDDDLVAFAVYVLDPVHEIVYHTVSQALPAKWIRWLDAPPPMTPASSGTEDSAPGATGASAAAEATGFERVPEDIRDIVEGGGVDPREWVAEWLEETLSLAVGVVAQRYVARRMGVGAGGIAKGKRRMEAALDDGHNAGEAARAGLI